MFTFVDFKMNLSVRTLFVVFILFNSLFLCPALSIDEFYPHGNGNEDASLDKADDVSSLEIFLKTPIRFYGELFSSIFVNSNGVLSFLTDIPTFFNIQFPLDYPVIAPLYTNVDLRGSGSVFYRETQAPHLLAKASDSIRSLYPNLANQFTATSLFITTWLDVGYYKQGSDKLNTYQVVIASDGDESFVQLLYKDSGIQWIQGTGFGSGLPDARAQAGFVSTDGRSFTLKGSGTDQIKNLDKWTNSDKPGLFTFRVGHVESSNVEPPQTTLDHDSEADVALSCSTSSTACHSQATCNDIDSGICCICRSGFYGNGITCLGDGIPLRVNGKVHLNINGQVTPDVDLQAYIVTADSRSYIALSRVPAQVGSSLQLLAPFASVTGWLFAKQVADSKNGYQLSGGIFNHTMEMKWQNENDPYSIKITQRFLGLDVFDQLKLEAEVHGNLPRFLPNTHINMPDQTHHFTKIGDGILRSQSTHTLHADNGQQYPVAIDQTILFKENCGLESMNFKLRNARNLISYEDQEKIVRFALTTKISKVSENDDPCLEGQVTCVANSSCLVEGDSFRCVCNPGFRTMYSGDGDDYGCVDINECSEGTATCDRNAICINQVGSFGCQCKPNFSGDGFHCTEIVTSPCQSDPSLCNQPFSYCVNSSDISTCSCYPGFDKILRDDSSAFHCEDINECTSQDLVCHLDAVCENTEGSFECRCNPGFRGDGFHCEYIDEHDTCQAVACSRDADCFEDPYDGAKCVCRTGFIGDGHTCRLQPYTGNENRSDCSSCSRYAYCREGRCICNQGYSGNGLYCTVSSKTTLKTCLADTCWCPPNYVEESGSSPICILSEPSSPGVISDPYGDRYNASGYGGELQFPMSQCITESLCFCPSGYLLKNGSCFPIPKAHAGIQSLTTKGQSGISYSCNKINNCHPDAQCIYITDDQSYRCRCNAGFEGDGFDCTETEVSCHEVDLCDLNANCVYDAGSGKSICICNPGYQGDGTFCYKISNEPCNCHPDANCLTEPSSGQSYCQCRPGFSGDGVTACQQTALSSPPNCNLLNNCAPTAVCLFSNEHNEYRCKCRPGYEGDGLVCHKLDSCHDDPSLCHKSASCIQISYNEFQCQCLPGFVGNGQKCREAYTGGDEFLLVNQGMATLRVPFHPSKSDPGYPIQLKTEQIAIGLAADCVEGRVYWSDIMSRAIKSSAYNGSELEDFITEGIESPEGLVIDWKNRDLYWTDSRSDDISVMNLDSRETKKIVTSGLVNPRGIAVHPRRRKLYWSDWNRASPKLEYADLDGSNKAILVQGPAVQLPNSLAIDWQTDELCWADAGTKSIECISLSTNIRRTVVTNCNYPFGLAITNDKYYWTDWDTQKIESSWKHSGERAESIPVPLGGAGKLYGIVPVTGTCPPS